MAIIVDRLSKTFGRGPLARRALDNVSFSIARGEMVALIGSSGSGKSTLMRHLSGLLPSDRCSGGIRIAGGPVQEGGRIAAGVRDRRARVGVVFQQFNLVGRLSVLTNVCIGLLHGMPSWRSLTMQFSEAERRRALDCLARVGMAGFAGQRAATLSGGQQQRVAIARALAQRAEVILGDEPIASLDPESSREVMEALERINREDGATMLVSLHQVDYARAYCQRAIALRDGRVVYDGPCAGLDTGELSRIYARIREPAVGPRPAPAGQPIPEAALAAI